MADGQWSIRQWNPSGKTATTHKIPVWYDQETDAWVPEVTVTEHALGFTWPDGRLELYPWCSIIKAEHTPPAQDEWPQPGDVL